MPIIFRKDQEKPLSSAEVDQNFKELDDRLQALESKSDLKPPLASVELQGLDLIFEGTGGAKFPAVKLPLITWNPQGKWAPLANYAPYDVVQYGRSLYVCHKRHTSPPSEEEKNHWAAKSWPEYWTLVFSMPVLPSIAVYENPQKGDLGLTKDQTPAFYDGKEWIDLTRSRA